MKNDEEEIMGKTSKFQDKEPLPVRCYSAMVSGDGGECETFYLIATSYAEVVRKTILHCDLDDEEDICAIHVMNGEAIQ